MKKVLFVVILLGVIGAGMLGYLYLKPTAAASAPIEAIPLATQAMPEPTATSILSTTKEGMPAVTPGVTPTEPVNTQAGVIFQIDPTQSKARFVIHEILNGTSKTVIGETDQISGQLSIDPSVPVNSQVGVIQVNTRTLTTDNEFRNRAVKNRILMTDQYEFATFTPVEISGLPDQVVVGQSFSFQITGDLTIRDVTQRVTFDAEVTPVSEDQIQGKASTTILYADYGIVIPEVPAVTGVSDEVQLEIEFTALPLG